MPICQLFKIKKRHIASFLNKCDLDWIQTSNLLSRNQVRYSVAPRGLNSGCKYKDIYY